MTRGLLATLYGSIYAEHPGPCTLSEKASFAAHLKQIWLEPDKKLAPGGDLFIRRLL